MDLDWQVLVPALTMSGKYPVGAVDTWAFGCLIHEIFNGILHRPEDLGREAGKIPRNLFSIMKPFVNPNPSARSSQIPSLLGRNSGGYFDNEIIKISSFLEQWALKEGEITLNVILKISRRKGPVYIKVKFRDLGRVSYRISKVSDTPRSHLCSRIRWREVQPLLLTA